MSGDIIAAMTVGTVMMGFGVSVVSAASGAGAVGEPIESEARAFCSAVVALEDTLMIDNPEARDLAIELVTATAPDDAQEAIERLAENVRDPFDPGYIEARTALIETAAGVCSWPEFEVEARDHEYLGLQGSELSAETWVLYLSNNGDEYHELKIYEVDEAAEGMTITEILERDDWQDLLIGPKGSASAAPGDRAPSNPVALTPGRWAAVCFIALGTTSATEIGEPAGDEDLHWMEGQTAEFIVA